MSNSPSLPLRILPILACASILAGCASTAPHDQLTLFGAGNAQGTLASGKGDMVFDGLYYYRLSRGKASALTASETLADAWAVRFRPDLVVALPANFRMDALLDRVDRAVPDRSMPCAFRVAGQFADVAVSSPAGNASIRQAFGNLYGFRSPGFDGKTRRELWFLSSDYSAGGRVTAFTLADGSLAIDLCPSLLSVNTAASQAEKQLR